MNDIQKSLQKRYGGLHPLIFQRSLEKAKTNGELFDILEEVSHLEYPVIWDEEQRKWVHTDELLQSTLPKLPEPEPEEPDEPESYFQSENDD